MKVLESNAGMSTSNLVAIPPTHQANTHVTTARMMFGHVQIHVMANVDATKKQSVEKGPM